MNISKYSRKCRGYTAFILLSLVITALDIYTTYILYGRDHIEWNPFRYYILTDFGSTTFILINFTFSVLLTAGEHKPVMVYP